jgi:hypothetical protein
METIRHKARKCATDLLPRASTHGTTELLHGCNELLVDLALALGCNHARTSGSPGYGILFETTRAPRFGWFTFFVASPSMPYGVAALAISHNAVRERTAELHTFVRDLCRHPGVAVVSGRKNPWPAIGFTSVEAGRHIIQAASAFLLNERPAVSPSPESTTDLRALRSIRLRRGQPAFRERLLTAYGARCVISGCDVVEALEAAHIVPHAQDGTYATSNGLLMRADLHTLFDLHLFSVCPDTGAVQLNPQLRTAYGQFEKQVLRLPLRQADRPDPQALAHHRAIWRSLL